jgi:hypothetical protein
VPYYSKQEKENKMTKKYKTKQTLIDEQKDQIKDLGYKIRLKEQMLEHSSYRIKEEARKISDMVSTQATITVTSHDASARFESIHRSWFIHLFHK